MSETNIINKTKELIVGKETPGDPGSASTRRSASRFRRAAVLAVAGYTALVFLTTQGVNIWFKRQEADTNLYFSLATALIISWMIVLVAYYIWALQFYNVNHGWSMRAWRRLEASDKSDKPDEQKGKHAPKENPHAGETLGLPNGTIRGTIAVSLLVGALAMMIASLGMEPELNANSFYVDNFDFFKTAFLMMIAFYFGNKSLDFLKNRSKVISTGPAGDKENKGSDGNASG